MNLHKKISRKNKIYRDWHRTDRHNVLHWTAFLAVVILSSLTLVATSDKVALENETQLGNVWTSVDFK